MNDYVQKKIVGWTLALVLVLGLIEVKILLLPPSTVLRAQNKVQKSRIPASAPSATLTQQSNIILDETNETLDYEVPCVSKNTQISVGYSHQIRLQFAKCEAHFAGIKILSISNATNSYDATIFDLDDGQQSSDFVPLKEGANRFKITFIDTKNQKSVQEYVFTRFTPEPRTSHAPWGH